MNLMVILLLLLLLATLVSAVIVMSAVKLSARARRFEDEFGDDLALGEDGPKDEAASVKNDAASVKDQAVSG